MRRELARQFLPFGECFRRGQALELMISTRSPRATASMERYCGVLTVSYRGRLLRRSAARSARALNAWPTTASVHGEYRSSLASRACVLPRQPGPPARRKVAPVAGVRVVTLCKLIDLVSRSTLYRSYQNSLASTLAESNVLGISVYNQRPARNFKPYDSTP